MRNENGGKLNATEGTAQREEIERRKEAEEDRQRVKKEEEQRGRDVDSAGPKGDSTTERSPCLGR